MLRLTETLSPFGVGVMAQLRMAPDAPVSPAPTVPSQKPSNPQFSTGPTTKFPGWSPDKLVAAELGRSHRSKPGKAKLKEVIDRSKAILGIPDDWIVGIIAGSDTGAVEAAMWNLFGARGTDVLVWENFGNDWAKNAKDQLKLDDLRVIKAGYGEMIDLAQVDFSRDVCMTWNGTTSGVKLADGDWIPDDREGLVLADATSAAFAMDLPWNKLDIVTWSWQKVLGGEAAHGMLALNPRAVQRMSEYKPNWPIPKIYQLRKGDGVNGAIFEGATQNTPSMLAVEDCLAALDWAQELGGLPALIARTEANAQVLFDWIEATPWVENLCAEDKYRSTTAVCLKIVDPRVAALPDEEQQGFAKAMVKLLDTQDAAYDVGAYRSAPSGLRIWTGSTVEAADLKALTPWLDYAFAKVAEDLFQ